MNKEEFEKEYIEKFKELNCDFFCTDFNDPKECKAYNNKRSSDMAKNISNNYPITCKDAVDILEGIDWGQHERWLKNKRW